MKKRMGFFLLIALNVFICQAQKKSGVYQSLLWRITGNNLNHPSYVFGTMHLTDKRIFNFSDSLYHFLESTDGYAAELDMQELMPEMIAETSVKQSDSTRITDIIKPAALSKYRLKLEQRMHKPLEKITIAELRTARGKLTRQFIKNGEMNTIIDMYLFDIAKRQGKWVGGIEDLDDQMKQESESEETLSIIDEITRDQDALKKSVEWMVNSYLKQDLNAIDLTNSVWKGAESNALIKRNIKMARRIDSIMSIRTCLFAVGAAHLPGDSGLVELLRSRGFIVEPVTSTKTIAPANYTFKEKETQWIATTVKDNWYSLLMPGKSSPFKSDNLPFDIQVYVDLSRMNTYFSFGAAIPKNRIFKADSIYQQMAAKYAEKGSIVSEKDISVNGTAGKEFIIKNEEMDMRLQTFLRPDAVVVNAMSSYKRDSLFGSDAKKYFESFKVLKAAPSFTVVSWQPYLFPQHAFSVKFPNAYKKQKRDITNDSAWRTNVYETSYYNDSIDIYCAVKVMEAKSGYYSNTDSTYFESVKQDMLASSEGKVTDSAVIETEGFPGYEFSINFRHNNTALKSITRVFNRGSRRYFIYTIHADTRASKNQSQLFLNSFNLLPIPEQKWSFESSPWQDISVWSPTTLTIKKSSSINSTPGLIIYDSMAPASILIYKEPLSPYLWWPSDSLYFREQTSRFISNASDSLRSFTLTSSGTIKGADFFVSNHSSHNLKKVHLWVYGDTLYYMFGFLPAQMLAGENYNRMFNEIKFSAERPGDFLLKNKTDRIIKDLTVGDSASFESAKNGLGGIKFTAADLPKLQNALLQPYRDFDPSTFCVHDNLINKVMDADDGSTYQFIKTNYPQLKDSTAILKYPFLSVLLRLKTKESYELFSQLLQQKIPGKGNPMILQYAFNDSLKLSTAIFPAILALSTDTSFIKLLPVISNTLLDSGMVNLSQFDGYKKYFYALAERQIKKLRLEKPVYDQQSISIINFLSHFKEQASYQLLHRFLGTTALAVKNAAAVALIENNQQADPLELEKIAADDSYRIDLYEKLSELHKEKFFPIKFLSQRSIAKSQLYQYVSEEYDADAIDFVAEKSVMFMGKLQRFYLFKVSYDGEDGQVSRLAITGPYAKPGSKIVARSQVMGVYQDEEFDSKKINDQLNLYLKDWEKYLNEKDQKEN